MIESYLVLAERIRKELKDLERLVARAEGATTCLNRRRHPKLR